MIPCAVCRTIRRNNIALVRHESEPGTTDDTALCLGHALQEDHPCICGSPKWSCHIQGCGTWVPIDANCASLLKFIWDALHELSEAT